MKKLLIFLMIAIPLIIIVVVNLTVNVVTGLVAISVDSIELDITQIEANINEIFSLTATVYPRNASNQEVLWESTNEEVALVDLNGNVSFVGFGKGYITATSVDGNKKASCFFYVTDTEVHQVTIYSDFSENGNYFVGLGETLQLKSTVLPIEAENRNVIYSSDDESIASVDTNGLVRGVSEGRVRISAVSEQKPEVSNDIIVQVVKPLERITLSSESDVTSANTYQISYGVYPLDASVSSVIYSSNDEDVATVSSSGLVSFKQAGEVEITLTSVQGQKTATMKIVYTQGFAYDLIIDNTSISENINTGGTYIQYSTLPLSLDVDVTFSSDNEDVAYVNSSGYVQFMGGGNTVIRVRIPSSENEYIEKVVSVFVESPAISILIDEEISVAKNTYTLNPVSYPSSSTNKNFFFHSLDPNIAVVSDKGEVSFLKNEICWVDIEIYANFDYSDVKKTVRLFYTNGYATKMELKEDNLEIDYGEYAQIVCILTPSDTIFSEVSYEIVSQQQNGGGDKVVEILSDGTIKAVGGGQAVIEVSLEDYEGQIIKKTCSITVKRKVEEFGVRTDIEFYNNEFVTCSPVSEFEFFVKTNDASNKNFQWKLNNSVAVKNGDNGINFNSAGVAEVCVYSADGGCIQTFLFRYMKNQIIEAKFNEIPSKLEVGQSFDLNVVSTIPSNIEVKSVLSASNQITLNPLGKTIEINGNCITAVAGGYAKISVKVANLQYSFELSTIQKASEIIVTPANISTTNSRVILQTRVLPEDTSNQEIEFIVDDPSIAKVENGVLVFIKNGKVNITAKSVDGSNVDHKFWIEKIDKGTGEVTPGGEPIVMFVGDTNVVDFSLIDFEYKDCEFRIVSQESLESGVNVIEISKDGMIKAINLGKAKLNCILSNEYGQERNVEVEIIVAQLAEDIEFNSDLDVVLGEFVTAVASVDMNFKMLPNYTTNKTYTVSLVDFVAQSKEHDGSYNPYIDKEKNQLIFRVPGTAQIKVSSRDGNVEKQFRIKYTGGDAVSVELNTQSQVYLEVGKSFEIEVQKWIPNNTQNKQIFVKEISHTHGTKVVEINGTKISALAGGESLVQVELSNGITYDIEIIVITMIEEIDICSEIMISSQTYNLEPSILPSNATIKDLTFSIISGQGATISKNVLTFQKPSTVVVRISATDGSGVYKDVKVTSTFGFVGKIILNTNQKDLSKNATFTLFVKDVLPSDVHDYEVGFKVVESLSNDNSSKDVVSVTSTGRVKALCGGEAVVRVFCLDYYGNEVYQDVKFTVHSPIESVALDFNKELKTFNGSIPVAQDSLEFVTKVSPSDASAKDVKVLASDESIARVEGNKVKFLKEGIVKIKVVAIENEGISEEYTFYYTENKIISAKLDFSRLNQNNQLVLSASEEYSLKLNDYLPKDATNINFTISDLKENRIDSMKKVISFNKGVIRAENGGVASFKVSVDGLDIGTMNVVVLRSCDEIFVPNENVYINNSSYKITAQAYPSDTYETDLVYEKIAGKGSVDNLGNVKFADYGVIEVKISSLHHSNVYKVVRIEYANEVKNIMFNDTITTIYTKDSLTLTVIGQPYGVSGFEVKFVSDNSELISIKQNGLSAKIIASDKQGDVTVTAYVVGKEDISVSRTFHIQQSLSLIELELDEVDDKKGLGEYRVWGTKFIDSDLLEDEEFADSFEIGIKAIKPADSSIPLVWTSSDESIATVEETETYGKAKITVLSAGKVTITVAPKVQYDKENPIQDSYTFTFVDGVNVYSFDEFGYVVVNTEENVVIQKNLIAKDSEYQYEVLDVKANVFGNGNMIDYSGASIENVWGGKLGARFYIKNDNLLFDNVIIKGESFNENEAGLSTLEVQNRLIGVGIDGYRIKNFRMNNCELLNALMGLEVQDSEVILTGCVIRNTFSGGIVIGSSEGSSVVGRVTVEDCIFSKSLLSSIVFMPHNYRNSQSDILNVKGELLIYNWIKVQDFDAGSDIKQYVSDASQQIQKIMKNYRQFIYVDSAGNEYIMPGITSIQVYGSAAGISVVNYLTNPSVNFLSKCNYSLVHVEGNVTVFGVGNANCNMDIYSLPANTNFITPYSDYSTKYKTIKKPMATI